MTTPALQVQVGIAGTDTPTSSASVTWTTVTDDLELGDSGSPVEITWGRADEIAQADPNSCTLTFAATEFKQASTGPYAVLEDTSQQVVIGQALRVRGTATGFTARQRFVGYVSAITPLWPDGDVDHLRVSVRAESRLAWVARAKQLQDRTSAALLAAGATSYWPMTEVITDNDNISDPSPPWFEFDEQPNIRAMGNNPSGLSVAFAWPAGTESGWGPSPDGLPVANFEIASQDPADPKIAAAQVGPIPILARTSGWTLALIARSDRTPRTEDRKFLPFALRGRDDLGFYSATRSGGYIQAAWFAITDFDPYWSITIYDDTDDLVDAVFGGTTDYSPRDKRWHLYTMTSTGGTTPIVTLYVDREAMVSVNLSPGDLSHYNSISVGNMSYIPDGADANNPRHEFGRLAIINGTALSAGQVADLYDNIITGTLGTDDTVEERLDRWFAYAGFPANRLTVTDPGTTPLTAQDVNGASPLQLLQDVASTDGGVLYDSRSAMNTTYLGRSVRLTATSSMTLDVETQEIDAGLTTPADLSAVVNSVTAIAADGSAKITRTDGASVARVGYSGEEQTLFTNSAAHLVGRADWRLHTSSVSRARAPGLSLELAALSDAQQDAVLGLGMWSVVTLDGLPADVDGVPASFFVEGGTETWSHQSCTVSLNVTDASPELEVGAWDSGLFNNATFG